MAAENTSTAQSYESELVLTRIFGVPRNLVWKAWTDPRQLAQWWGPNGFTNPVCKLDLRPGGAIRIEMRAPDGATYPMSGVFREIVEPGRLVFVSAPLDQQGNPMFEVLNTVTLDDEGGKTKLTVHAQVIKTTALAPQYLRGMRAGWAQSLERLRNIFGSNSTRKEFTMQLNPYLNFNGQCEEAFRFYERCLGATIEMMMTHEQAPSAEQVPPQWRNKVMHARLSLGDKLLMGSDAPPDRYQKPQGFSVSLSVDKPADAERIFAALAEKGAVQMPIQKTFWAERFGAVIDRFGIPWMINCEQPA